jgi:hypothetical protein
MPEDEKYDVLEKIGAHWDPYLLHTAYTDASIGHGSFGIIRKVKRKSDGYVRPHCLGARCGC